MPRTCSRVPKANVSFSWQVGFHEAGGMILQMPALEAAQVGGADKVGHLRSGGPELGELQ